MLPKVPKAGALRRYIRGERHTSSHAPSQRRKSFRPLSLTSSSASAMSSGHFRGRKRWPPIVFALASVLACQGGQAHRAVAIADAATARAPERQGTTSEKVKTGQGVSTNSEGMPTHADETPSPANKVQQIDRDGADDLEAEGEGPFPTRAHFERVGRAPISLRHICDLTPFGDALYAAHSLAPLGADGATVSRYRPSDSKRPFATAFDWNRPGEPSKGGGAGQGFLRVRAIEGRLYVPDADPPYNGFGLMDWGTEGYVFVSKGDGTFAYASRPHFRPPARPTVEGRAGAMVIPRSYHDFDVIRFRGHLIASTGAVPPKERAWYGPSPGALHVATADLSHFEYAVSYPSPYVGGVWRLTYMVRFRDRLYAGIEDYDGRSPDDFIMLTPAQGSDEIRQEDVHPVRVTPHGAAQTVRWYADRGQLYWIAWGRDGTWLRVTSDGDHWSSVELPPDAGAPTDIARFRGQLIVLTEYSLLRLEGSQTTTIASVTEKKSPFETRDGLCAAPLAVFENDLYAGGQRDGALYRLVSEP
jgi:hypothetical protein